MQNLKNKNKFIRSPLLLIYCCFAFRWTSCHMTDFWLKIVKIGSLDFYALPQGQLTVFCVSTWQRQVVYIEVQKINWLWLCMLRIYRLTTWVQEWVSWDGREGDIAIVRWDRSVEGPFGPGTVYPTLQFALTPSSPLSTSFSWHGANTFHNISSNVRQYQSWQARYL